MLPMSNPTIAPGAVETQQMRVVAPVGVRYSQSSSQCPADLFSLQSNVRLRLRIAYSIAGQNVQEQIDFAGFPPGLTGTPS